MNTLLDKASQFGANGFFALLIGQKVEYRQPYQPSADELRIWNAERQKYKNMAMRGLTVRTPWPGFVRQIGNGAPRRERCERDELLEALTEVHAGGSPMTSNIARKVVQSFQRLGAQSSEAEDLSPREREVLELLARGYLYKEIAESLHFSVPTVNTYIRRIYEKLHVRSRSQAVAKFTHVHGATSVGGPRNVK